MRTITTESSRLPDPDSYFPALVVKNWAAKRIAQLEAKETLTAAEAKSLERIKAVSANTTLMEPPVLGDNNEVKVCILSRSAGTLWVDEPVPKVTFDEFLVLAFGESIPFSTLNKAEPFTIEELTALANGDVSAPIPGFIHVLDSEGGKHLCIIGDVLDESTVDREKLFGKYKFEKSVTEVYGYVGDNRPAYPFNALEDLSIAITKVTDTLLAEDTTIYSISINLLKGLVAEHNSPPKITKVENPIGAIIEEQPVPADYVIGKGTLVTFDKVPKVSDLEVKSLVDDQGNTIDPENFSVRILPTADPLVQSLEITLKNYQRRFFTADAVSRKNGFKLTISSTGVTKTNVVKIALNWDLPDNAIAAAIENNKGSWSDLNKVALAVSLAVRTEGTQIVDLTPLAFPADPTDIFLKDYPVPTVLDDKFVLSQVNGKPVITFNIKLDEFGLFAIDFADKRIARSFNFVVDPEGEYSIGADGYAAEKDSTIAISAQLTTPYGSAASNGTLVTEYKDMKLIVNDVEVEGLKVVADKVVGNTAFVVNTDLAIDPINIKWKLSGVAVMGLNQVEYPFEVEGIIGEQEPVEPTDPNATKPGLKDKDGNVIADGATTTDNKPTLSGEGMKPGSTVVIKDNGVKIGEAVVDSEGKWTFTPETALANGSHEINIKGTDRNDMNVDKTTAIIVATPVDPVDPEGPTAEEIALADPTEGGKYAGAGEAGMGGTIEPLKNISDVTAAYDFTGVVLDLQLPYVERGSID